MNIRRQLAIFYGIAAVVLLTVASGAVIASRSVARAQALQDSERMADRLARIVVGPLLPAVLAGDADERADLDAAIQARIAEGSLSEIAVWRLDGMVVYADDVSETGQHDAPDEVSTAIIDGKASSDFETRPEITAADFNPDNQGFVEVYVPLTLAGQPPYAFEAYYDYSRVNDAANLLLWHLLPVVLVPLLILQLTQVPIAGSLARRLRRHERDRSRLLEKALSTSERERIRIAGDLHDGPIQDLAGIGYALAAVQPAVPVEHRPVMIAVDAAVHDAIDSLRRLMVDLYPPDLSSARLPEIIAELTRPLSDRDIEVTLNMTPPPQMHLDIVTTLYRVARESLANVLEHSNATSVEITLAADHLDRPVVEPTVTLQIADDGIGIGRQSIDRRADGHLGLRLLQDRVETLGGALNITSGPTGGTTVNARIPLDGVPLI